MKTEGLILSCNANLFTFVKEVYKYLIFNKKKQIFDRKIQQFRISIKHIIRICLYYALIIIIATK